MRIPLTFLIVLAFIAVGTNRDRIASLITNGTSPADWVRGVGEMFALTANRVVNGLSSSFGAYQAGDTIALGLFALYAIAFIALFILVLKLGGFAIGLLHPVASEERKKLIAFVLACFVMAVWVGITEPVFVLSLISLVAVSFLLLEFLRRHRAKPKPKMEKLEKWIKVQS